MPTQKKQFLAVVRSPQVPPAFQPHPGFAPTPVTTEELLACSDRELAFHALALISTKGQRARLSPIELAIQLVVHVNGLFASGLTARVQGAFLDPREVVAAHVAIGATEAARLLERALALQRAIAEREDLSESDDDDVLVLSEPTPEQAQLRSVEQNIVREQLELILRQAGSTARTLIASGHRFSAPSPVKSTDVVVDGLRPVRVSIGEHDGALVLRHLRKDGAALELVDPRSGALTTLVSGREKIDAAAWNGETVWWGEGRFLLASARAPFRPRGVLALKVGKVAGIEDQFVGLGAAEGGLFAIVNGAELGEQHLVWIDSSGSARRVAEDLSSGAPFAVAGNRAFWHDSEGRFRSADREGTVATLLEETVHHLAVDGDSLLFATEGAVWRVGPKDARPREVLRLRGETVGQLTRDGLLSRRAGARHFRPLDGSGPTPVKFPRGMAMETMAGGVGFGLFVNTPDTVQLVRCSLAPGKRGRGRRKA